MYLEGGLYVRASETIGEISLAIDDPGLAGWIPVEDPGDGRSKLIRGNRVLWIEQEVEAS